MNDLCKLKYLDFIEIGEDIWFSNLYFNALIKINKSSGIIQIIDKFPNYNIEETWLYIAVYMIKDKLFFVPHKSKEIVSYDMISKKFISIPLDLDVIGKTEGYFLSAYAYENFIYMFPAYTRYIIRFDVQDNSIVYLDQGLSTALKELPPKAVCFIKEFEIIGNKIYIPFAMLNAIAIFDLEKEKLEIKYLNIIGGCSTIKYTEGYFYMASSKNYQIYRWDEKNNEIMVYDIFPDEFISKDFLFSCSCVFDKKIIFMPLVSNMIISLDLQTKELCCEKQINNENMVGWDTYFAKRKNDKLILMREDMPTLCLLEHEGKYLKYTPYFSLDDSFNKRRIRDFFIINMYYNVIQEGKILVEEYIKALKILSRLDLSNERKKIGKNIFYKIWKDRSTDEIERF